VIPIRDDIPSRRPAVGTKILLLVTIGVFLYQLMQQSQGPFVQLPFRCGGVLSAFDANFSLIPALFPDHPLTALTAIFLHGGLWHLVSNMLFLWIFGDNVEDHFGSFGFLFLYLGGGVIASLTQYITSPTSCTPVLGASGAVAAVLGAYLLLYPRARVLMIVPFFFFLNFWLPAPFFLGFWFITQIYNGLSNIGGVAWWAHIGGFLAGVLAVSLLAPPRRPRAPMY